MGGQDVIVVGASAGGVEALSSLVGDLPEDLPAAVFVVLHMGPHSATALPNILARRTKLPVDHPHDGEPIELNRIYVAVPDRHMVLRGGAVRVVQGPKENGHRPSIDALFRSAAGAYGQRVAGVILSGTRDDGAAGMRAVHDGGGVAIVQDPAEALFPGMPQAALAGAGGHPDHVLPVAEIGKLLAKVARGAHPSGSETVPEELDVACPDGFPADSLLVEQSTDVEAALWTAYRALEERAALFGRLAARARGRRAEITAEHFRAEGVTVNRQAEVLRAVLGSRARTGDEGQSGPAES